MCRDYPALTGGTDCHRNDIEEPSLRVHRQGSTSLGSCMGSVFLCKYALAGYTNTVHQFAWESVTQARSVLAFDMIPPELRERLIRNLAQKAS